MQENEVLSEFNRKPYWYPFSRHFYFLSIGIVCLIIAISESIYNNRGSGFVIYIFALVFILFSIIEFSTRPKRIILNNVGVEIGDFCFNWDQVEIIKFKLSLFQRPTSHIIEIFLKDGQSVIISLPSFFNNDKLRREFERLAKDAGIKTWRND